MVWTIVTGRLPGYILIDGSETMHWWFLIPAALAGALIGVLIGYFYRKNVAEAKIAKAEDAVRTLLDDAQKKAEEIRKEKELEAKEEIYKLRTEAEKENRDRRNELQRTERRLFQREETLDKKIEAVEAREQAMNQRVAKVEKREADAEALVQQQEQELERISGLTVESAKEMLLARVEEEAKHDAAILLRDIEQKTKEEADRKARNIVTLAIQRCAADHVAEATVSVVPLPNDEMKGRIIGREGRNIRALETATGVDLIIDDTPEAVILSAFDPVRREIARIALEKLIMDGRIHPARIEEMVEKAKKEVSNQIREAGEAAVLEVGVHGLHHELIRYLGRMKYPPCWRWASMGCTMSSSGIWAA